MQTRYSKPAVRRLCPDDIAGEGVHDGCVKEGIGLIAEGCGHGVSEGEGM